MKSRILSNLFGGKSSEIVEDVSETVQTFSKRGQASKVHDGDMLSDSWMSKNVRPLTILWLLFLFTISLFATISETSEDTIQYALLLCLGFYFPGRDAVKTFTRNQRKKKSNGEKEN